MKNKFIKSLLFLIIGIVGIFSTTTVNAETYNGGFGDGDVIETKVYVNKREPNGYMRWQRVHSLIKYDTGQVVYCMQPMVLIQDGAIYNLTTEDYAGAQNLTAAQYDRIRLLAYYGYGYGNHTSTDWISVTQVAIWRTTRPDMDIFYSWGQQGENRDDSIFADKFAELENLLATHYNRPSFNTNTIETIIGKTEVVNDSNNVLNKYQIKSQSNVRALINGNSLNVTATGVGTGEITLEKAERRFGEDPIIFYAVDSQNIIKPGDPKPVLAKLNLKINGGKITVNKLDDETKENTPQGEASLSSAIYSIFNENDEEVGTITTGEDGKVTSDYLPSLGKFYVKEKTPSTGYELDTRKYEFELTLDNLNPEIDVFEKVIKVKYNLTKVIAQNKTGDMIPEVGVKFAFIDKNGNTVQEVFTDNEGKLSVELPYGTYTVKQLTSTPGHEKIEDYTLEVKKTETINKVLGNAEITAKLRVVKIDKDTKEVIKRSGIKFRILDTKTNEYVCQTVTYPNKETLCEFETDKNGEFITPEVLKSGTYKLEEIDQKIDGYLWNKESHEFTIDENSELRADSEYGIIFDTDFENKRVKGEVRIEKIGHNVQIAEEGLIIIEEPLEGIKFCIYSKDDKEIKCGLTDSDGKLTFTDLDLGDYYVKEIETLEGYILDESKHELSLKYKDQYTPVITYETILENYVPTGKLEFTKTDFSESKTLPNTTIEIYSENDILIYSGKTDENGKIVIDQLPIGKFYILEKEAPEGYELNEEKMWFEIKENGEVVKATMKDNQIIEVPDTYIDKSNIRMICGLVFIVIGTGVLIYEEKKNRKR